MENENGLDVIKTELHIESGMLGIKVEEETGKKFVISGPEVHSYHKNGAISVSFPIQYL